MEFIEKRKQLEAALIKKAKSDSKFEELFLSDPKAALKELGVNLPADVKISVTKEKENELIIVYPTALTEGELDESELRVATGGNLIDSQKLIH